MFRKLSISIIIALFLFSSTGLPLIMHHCKMAGITVSEANCTCKKNDTENHLSEHFINSNSSCCTEVIIEKYEAQNYIASYKFNVAEEYLSADYEILSDVLQQEFYSTLNTSFYSYNNNLYIKNSVLLI